MRNGYVTAIANLICFHNHKTQVEISSFHLFFRDTAFWMNSLDKTDQVIINLKVVSTLSEGERLCLRNNNFSIYSPGWAQAIYRWISGETRWVNMDDLKSVINDAIRILGTYINMVQHAYTPVAGSDRHAFAVPTPQTSIGFVTSMARELKAATGGLHNLRKTYAGDQLITATFDLLIERTLLEIQKAEETIQAFHSVHGRKTPANDATTEDTTQPIQSSLDPCIATAQPLAAPATVQPLVQPMVQPLVQPLVQPMVQPLVQPMVQPLATVQPPTRTNKPTNSSGSRATRPVSGGAGGTSSGAGGAGTAAVVTYHDTTTSLVSALYNDNKDD